MRTIHPLKPVYSKSSKVLILGTMPSITSRELKKYYGNKTNRFWKVLEAIYGEKIEDWETFIIEHNLALWDVIASCEIDASKDSSIKKVIPNDIASLLKDTQISYIYTLGNKAYELYNRYIRKSTNIEAGLLPSTSSANAKESLSSLIEKFSVIKEKTDN